ncbi:MAG: DUF6516 family protein [Candidatus Sigynarchaeota archaeon]
MNGIDKLRRAREILETELATSVISSELNARLKRFRGILRDGTTIYVQYNDHDEYIYSIFYSSQELDRVRFDNFDNLWNVPTKPHHVHPRYKEDGERSTMNGNPEIDMRILANILKNTSAST